MGPQLLDTLAFRSNNQAHQPVIDALELVKRYGLNSNKGTKTLTNVLLLKGFGNSAVPEIGACLVHQFWGLNTDRILQPLLQKVLHSPNSLPPGVYRMHSPTDLGP